MSKDKGIKLSPKHGLNPSMDLCFWCGEPKGVILCGHMHSAFSDRFSDTAMQYVVGGNFKGDACEILFT